jgi:hypothetical protein
MPRESIPLIRLGGFQQAEKLFILAYEGEQTEKKYFSVLRNSDLFNDSGIIEIISLPRPKRVGTDPLSVKTVLKTAKSEYRFKDTDEFWLIVDRDHWEEKHNHSFDKIVEDCEKEGNMFLALSNPCFEIWIILHFKDPKEISEEEFSGILLNEKVGSKNYVSEYIAKILEQGRGYNKNPPSHLMLPKTKIAIERARGLDISGEKYPKVVGTHVYKLIEKLIK